MQKRADAQGKWIYAFEYALCFEKQNSCAGIAEWRSIETQIILQRHWVVKEVWRVSRKRLPLENVSWWHLNYVQFQRRMNEKKYFALSYLGIFWKLHVTLEFQETLIERLTIDKNPKLWSFICAIMSDIDFTLIGFISTQVLIYNLIAIQCKKIISKIKMCSIIDSQNRGNKKKCGMESTYLEKKIANMKNMLPFIWKKKIDLFPASHSLWPNRFTFCPCSVCVTCPTGTISTKTCVRTEKLIFILKKQQ